MIFIPVVHCMLVLLLLSGYKISFMAIEIIEMSEINKLHRLFIARHVRMDLFGFFQFFFQIFLSGSLLFHTIF